MQKALFLDRDGTLIIDKHYLKKPEDIELIAGVDDFLKEALSYGYYLFLFTNQSGVSRGLHTFEDTVICNNRMFELLKLPEPGFMEVRIAIEGPDEEQVYRKPSPRFILEMIEKYDLDAKSCWMIGDKLSDVEAGINAGIKSAWVASGKELDEELEAFMKKHSIPALAQLSDFILKETLGNFHKKTKKFS